MDLLQRALWWLPDEVSTGWTYEVDVDVLLVGAGLQGLCLLDSLEAAGYSTALVAEEPIGAGPDGAWNGVFESGYGDPDPTVRRTVEDDWIPYLDAAETAHGDEWYAIARDRADERLRSKWDEFEYPHESATEEDLSREWREGDLFEGGSRYAVSEIDEHAVSKSDLLAEFVADDGDRIVRGEVRDCERGSPDGRIESVEIGLVSDEPLVIDPGHVVVTAGGRSADVVETLAGAEGSRDGSDGGEAPPEPLDSASFRDVHLLVIRAPRGALPETSVHLFPRELTVAARQESPVDGLGSVTWYVTSESFASAEEGSGRIDPRKVGAGYKELFSLVPAVQERAEEAGSDVEFGVFTGTRLESDEPYVAGPVEGVPNLDVAVSTPATAWLGADAVRETIDGTIEPTSEEVWLPGTVVVDDVQGPRDGATWLDWDELVVRYPGADPVSGPA